MNKSLIAAVALFLATSSQAFADGSCPMRSPDEGAKPFRARTHEYCEMKWQGLATKPAGESHDTYMNICARDCYKALGPSAGNLGSEFAGDALTISLATAGLVGVGVSVSSDSPSPASP